MTARSFTVESVVPTGPDCIRVFLCDDIPELRALMAFSLEDDERLVVVGEAGDGHGCVRGVSETQADVVLLDLSMPDCDGLHAIPLLRQQAPACAIVAVRAGCRAHSSTGDGRRCLCLSGEGRELLAHP